MVTKANPTRGPNASSRLYPRCDSTLAAHRPDESLNRRRVGRLRDCVRKPRGTKVCSIPTDALLTDAARHLLAGDTEQQPTAVARKNHRALRAPSLRSPSDRERPKLRRSDVQAHLAIARRSRQIVPTHRSEQSRPGQSQSPVLRHSFASPQHQSTIGPEQPDLSRVPELLQPTVERVLILLCGGLQLAAHKANLHSTGDVAPVSQVAQQ